MVELHGFTGSVYDCWFQIGFRVEDGSTTDTGGRTAASYTCSLVCKCNINPKP